MKSLGERVVSRTIARNAALRRRRRGLSAGKLIGGGNPQCRAHADQRPRDSGATTGGLSMEAEADGQRVLALIDQEGPVRRRVAGDGAPREVGVPAGEVVTDVEGGVRREVEGELDAAAQLARIGERPQVRLGGVGERRDRALGEQRERDDGIDAELQLEVGDRAEDATRGRAALGVAVLVAAEHAGAGEDGEAGRDAGGRARQRTHGEVVAVGAVSGPVLVCLETAALRFDAAHEGDLLAEGEGVAGEQAQGLELVGAEGGAGPAVDAYAQEGGLPGDEEAGGKEGGHRDGGLGWLVLDARRRGHWSEFYGVFDRELCAGRRWRRGARGEGVQECAGENEGETDSGCPGRHPRTILEVALRRAPNLKRLTGSCPRRRWPPAPRAAPGGARPPPRRGAPEPGSWRPRGARPPAGPLRPRSRRAKAR